MVRIPLNEERTPNYPRDETPLARLEAALAEQTARETRLLAGPKGNAARRASAKLIQSAKSSLSNVTICRNGRLFVRVPRA